MVRLPYYCWLETYDLSFQGCSIKMLENGAAILNFSSSFGGVWREYRMALIRNSAINVCCRVWSSIVNATALFDVILLPQQIDCDEFADITTEGIITSRTPSLMQQARSFVGQWLNLDVANLVVFLARGSLLSCCWTIANILVCEFGCTSIS
jgi:hypothetical protein